MGLDEAVAAAMTQEPWTLLLPLAGALALLGSAPAWYALGLGLLLLGRRSATPLLLALAAADLTSLALKEALARPRPEGAIFAGPDFAWPSGHALRAAAAAGVAALQAWPLSLRLAAVGYATLMAASRVVARAHWLSDVLAGLALGLAVGALIALAWAHDARGLRSRLLEAARPRR